jgi:hypothetical protein
VLLRLPFDAISQQIRIVGIEHYFVLILGHARWTILFRLIHDVDSILAFICEKFREPNSVRLARVTSARSKRK